MNPPKTLVLSGGGALGQVHLGVLRCLDENITLNDIHHFAANSIGAVVSLFLVAGYTLQELAELFMDFNLQDVLDATFDLNRIGISWGIEDGLLLEAFLINALAEKGHKTKSTFKELSVATGKELLIVATNVNTLLPCYFCTESTPDVCVVDAVRASVSIPVLISPKYIEGTPYWDGFICDNFPILEAKRLWPQNEVIGSLILSFKADKPNNFIDACVNLLGKKMVSHICLNCLEPTGNSRTAERIIKTSITSMTGLEYYMTPEEKQYCQDQGYLQATLSFAQIKT